MTNQERLARTYYKQVDKECPTLATYSRNLNLAYMEGQLEPCYYRDDYLAQIQKILLRKGKANVLLSGVAGCGKTAIVEGVAAQLVQRKIDYEIDCNHEWKRYKAIEQYKLGSYAYCDSDDDFVAPSKPFLCDAVIYDLSLTALVGGTPHRGEFEARMQKILDECKSHPDVILFIDEIHGLTVIGKSDGSENSAHALKPALARKEIRLIGATTTEEKACIAKDKALWRRFCEIVVQPLTGEAAEQTASKILADYCRFHEVSTDVSAAELLKMVQRKMPKSVFPDNFINIIDETLAGAVYDCLSSVEMDHFEHVLNRISGNACSTICEE